MVGLVPRVKHQLLRPNEGGGGGEEEKRKEERNLKQVQSAQGGQDGDRSSAGLGRSNEGIGGRRLQKRNRLGWRRKEQETWIRQKE